MTPNRLSWSLALAAGIVVAWCGVARAEGRAGSVEWSDGRKLTGAISLTPGKDLRIFTESTQFSLPLSAVKAIHFKAEREEMWEGFYFPTAGQATQAKTGEVYPIRYLRAQVTLTNGQLVEGHLLTTPLYVETDAATEKVVLLAKQTGANGEKLTDLVYPTDVRFDADGSSGGFSLIDLTQAGFVPLHPPVVVTQPDLNILLTVQTAGKPIWTVPSGNPGQLLFGVEAGDGIHVAWPAEASPGQQMDPDVRKIVETGLQTMNDFFDTRTMLGCFMGSDPTDIYSLVMLKRLGAQIDGFGNGIDRSQIPWSVVILQWKYDADQKRVVLIHRSLLAIGHADTKIPLPTVLIAPGLLNDISLGK